MRQVLAISVVGVVSVNEAFLPLLRISTAPRLIFVSLTTPSITLQLIQMAFCTVRTLIDYRTSKAALNMLIVLYWKQLEPEGFKLIGAKPCLNSTISIKV